MCVILYSFDRYVIRVCYVDCDGDEDRLKDCNIRTTSSSSCACSGGVVGITCSK